MSKKSLVNVSAFVPITITNSNANIPNDLIWIAIYGNDQEGNCQYLDASKLNASNQPIPQSISNLPKPGPDNPNAAILPSSTLTDWGNNLSMPIPFISGRILFSIGVPVQAIVNYIDHLAVSVSAPSASNAQDPSTGLICDFIEFNISDINEGYNVDIDTSLVDSFGIPMQLSLDGSITDGPVGISLNRDEIFGSESDSFNYFINSKSLLASSFLNCIIAPNRLVSPKDLSEIYNQSPYSDPFNNFLNSLIDDFFVQYFSGTIGKTTGGGQTFTITSSASGTSTAYSGTVQLISGNYVLQLKDASSNVYNIYYPFFKSNTSNSYTPVFPLLNPPIFLENPEESASQMVFACDGVFADSTLQPNVPNPSVLADIENQISCAFNRGVILESTSTWIDEATWYDATASNNGIYNYWVQYWHQSGISINNLAYAFPYDDDGNSSTNLNMDNATQIEINFNSWGSYQRPSMNVTASPSPSTQGGLTTFTANISGLGSEQPTGSITFYINGYAINPNGYPPGPNRNQPIPVPYPVKIVDGTATISANCPPLSDGANTHTYTVIALYSGDATYFPWTAYCPLQLTGQ